MHSSPALSAPDAHRLARAFLALSDDDGPQPAQQSHTRALVAVVAALALALAAPLTWMAPVAGARAKLGEQPAATLANSKALLAAADDEDDAGA